MTHESSIRKVIFRKELSFIFEHNNIRPYERDRIGSLLFENHLDPGMQLILKEEIRDIHGIDKELGKIKLNEVAKGAIKTLFLVQDDLELPSELKISVLKNEQIAVFVGAGVSRLLRLPLWKELADKAIAFLYEKNIIDYFEYQRITNEILDPKQKMTLFHQFIPKKSQESEVFYQKVFTKTSPLKENPYHILTESDWNWVKVTSNIDGQFPRALDAMLIRSIPDNGGARQDVAEAPKRAKKITQAFDIKNIDYDAIYEIHGSIENLERTIITTRDYVEAYFGETSQLKQFLSELFATYTTVFVGYGLQEFEVLEHIVSNKKRHYVLLGSYMNELNLFTLRKKYFENLNITPIRYYLDFRGYDRLNDVLNSWYQQIQKERGKDYYQKVREIDEEID
jgi:hypothetical protein